MRRISTKQKKELYSLSSLLFHLLVFIILLVSLGTDPKENIPGKDTSAMKDGAAIAGKQPDSYYKIFFTTLKR